MIALPLPKRLVDRLRRRRTKPVDIYARATSGELDIMKLPAYESVEDAKRRGLEEIEEHLAGLRPDGLDAGSRDVLSDLVDAWLAAEIAMLAPIHDERKAVATVLVGLAEQELTRREPRYEADMARVQHAREALDAATEALSGKRTERLQTRWPTRVDAGETVSSLGRTRYDTNENDGEPPAEPEDTGADQPGSSDHRTVAYVPRTDIAGEPDKQSANGHHQAMASPDDPGPTV